MDTLSQDQLKQLAILVADRTLAESDRESRAHSITGSKELVQRALDWLPEAFGLVALGRIEGLDLPTTLSAKDRSGTWHEFPLSAEPLYAQAIALTSDPEVPFKAVAEQSSCINAVDNALNSGVSIQEAQLPGPALVGTPAEAYFPFKGRLEIGA